MEVCDKGGEGEGEEEESYNIKTSTVVLIKTFMVKDQVLSIIILLISIIFRT